MTDDSIALAPDSAQRTAALVHVSALFGLCTGLFFLGPLVVWLLKRDEHPIIDAVGKDALNFQFTMLLATLVAGVLCAVLIGVPLLFIAVVATVVCPIIAAVRTANGEAYRYPAAIRFLK